VNDPLEAAKSRIWSGSMKKKNEINSARKCCLGGLFALALVLSLLAPPPVGADGGGGTNLPDPEDSVYRAAPSGTDSTMALTGTADSEGTGSIWWLIDLIL
jgi:hypothetical protein